MAKKDKKIKEEEIPTRTAYVVMTGSFEYDDNYYNQNDEGGNPVKVYLDKLRAEEACRKANIIELLTNELENYSWILRECGNSEKAEIIQAIREAGGKFQDNNDSGEFKITDLPDDATKEQINAILSALGIRFNTVEEIQLELMIE